jgi:hypothetical protein
MLWHILRFVWNTSRDSALVVKLFLAPVVQIAFCVHQEFQAAVSQDAGADRRFVVPMTNNARSLDCESSFASER